VTFVAYLSVSWRDVDKVRAAADGIPVREKALFPA